MKFEILKDELSKALSAVSKVVSTRPQIPVLSNVLIEAKKEGVVLSATDLEVGMRIEVAAKVIEEGVVTAPARMLFELVTNISAGKVEVALVKESLVIQAGGLKSKLQTIGAEEFPRLPDLVGREGIKFAATSFSERVGQVAFASAKDALRPVLTGILLETEEGEVRLVATDGFRLALAKLTGEGKVERARFLVPSRAIVEAARLFTEGEVRLVELSQNQVALVSEGTAIVSQLLEGNYPEYQKIVPMEFETEVTISREELLSAVKTVYIFARDNSNMVRVTVGESGLVLRSEAPERGEARVEVSATVSGGEGEAIFNGKFLMEYLANSVAEQVWFGMSGNLKPGAFREDGKKEGLYIVMPINA